MILIDREKRVTEVEIDVETWMEEVDVETVSAITPGHDLHVDAEAAFDPAVVHAVFAGRPDVPLPAWISGHEGERAVDASMTIEEARALLE